MEKKTKVIAFANNKGGSGKTTSCANIGYSLSVLGKKVLLVDGDMQLNLSLSFFGEDEVLEMAAGADNLYQAIKRQEDLRGCIVRTPYEGVDLVPSSTLMSGIEYELFTRWQRELILKKSLQPIRDIGEYDYILIDAPPTLGGWVANILCASDFVIMPVEASPWGLFGVANMFEFLEDIKQLNDKLQLLGIAVTKVDGRKAYDRQTIEALKQTEGVHVFEHVIRIDSEVGWAQDDSKPILVHKKSSRSAGEYMELTKEIDEDASRIR
ncbi:MAG: AAA family ATPase [Candidatus Gastranaerophilales bacterium]|nr:AAA family ATPase [Candidatus Gastranaerophilales bacterium]